MPPSLRVRLSREEGTRAELVTAGGHEYKKRHPWGAYGLALLTLGVYYLVWY